jgi:hypothetical protein
MRLIEPDISVEGRGPVVARTTNKAPMRANPAANLLSQVLSDTL